MKVGRHSAFPQQENHKYSTNPADENFRYSVVLFGQGCRRSLNVSTVCDQNEEVTRDTERDNNIPLVKAEIQIPTKLKQTEECGLNELKSDFSPSALSINNSIVIDEILNTSLQLIDETRVNDDPAFHEFFNAVETQFNELNQNNSKIRNQQLSNVEVTSRGLMKKRVIGQDLAKNSYQSTDDLHSDEHLPKTTIVRDVSLKSLSQLESEKRNNGLTNQLYRKTQSNFIAHNYELDEGSNGNNENSNKDSTESDEIHTTNPEINDCDQLENITSIRDKNSQSNQFSSSVENVYYCRRERGDSGFNVGTDCDQQCKTFNENRTFVASDICRYENLSQRLSPKVCILKRPGNMDMLPELYNTKRKISEVYPKYQRPSYRALQERNMYPTLHPIDENKSLVFKSGDQKASVGSKSGSPKESFGQEGRLLYTNESELCEHSIQGSTIQSSKQENYDGRSQTQKPHKSYVQASHQQISHSRPQSLDESSDSSADGGLRMYNDYQNRQSKKKMHDKHPFNYAAREETRAPKKTLRQLDHVSRLKSRSTSRCTIHDLRSKLSPAQKSVLERMNSGARARSEVSQKPVASRSSDQGSKCAKQTGVVPQATSQVLTKSLAQESTHQMMQLVKPSDVSATSPNRSNSNEMYYIPKLQLQIPNSILEHEKRLFNIQNSEVSTKKIRSQKPSTEEVHSAPKKLILLVNRTKTPTNNFRTRNSRQTNVDRRLKSQRQRCFNQSDCSHLSSNNHQQQLSVEMQRAPSRKKKCSRSRDSPSRLTVRSAQLQDECLKEEMGSCRFRSSELCNDAAESCKFANVHSQSVIMKDSRKCGNKNIRILIPSDSSSSSAKSSDSYTRLSVDTVMEEPICNTDKSSVCKTVKDHSLCRECAMSSYQKSETQLSRQSEGSRSTSSESDEPGSCANLLAGENYTTRISVTRLSTLSKVQEDVCTNLAPTSIDCDQTQCIEAVNPQPSVGRSRISSLTIGQDIQNTVVNSQPLMSRSIVVQTSTYDVIESMDAQTSVMSRSGMNSTIDQEVGNISVSYKKFMRSSISSLTIDQDMQNTDDIDSQPFMSRCIGVQTSTYDAIESMDAQTSVMSSSRVHSSMDQEVGNMSVAFKKPYMVQGSVHPSSFNDQEMPNIDVNTQLSVVKRSVFISTANNKEESDSDSCTTNSTAMISVATSTGNYQEMGTMDVVNARSYMVRRSVTPSSANDQEMQYMDEVDSQSSMVRSSVVRNSVYNRNMSNMDAINTQSFKLSRAHSSVNFYQKKQLEQSFVSGAVATSETQTELLLTCDECFNTVNTKPYMIRRSPATNLLPMVKRTVDRSSGNDQDMRYMDDNTQTSMKRRTVVSTSINDQEMQYMDVVNAHSSMVKRNVATSPANFQDMRRDCYCDTTRRSQRANNELRSSSCSSMSENEAIQNVPFGEIDDGESLQSVSSEDSSDQNSGNMDYTQPSTVRRCAASSSVCDQDMRSMNFNNKQPPIVRRTLVPSSAYDEEMGRIYVVNGRTFMTRRSVDTRSENSVQENQCQQSYVSRHTVTSQTQTERLYKYDERCNLLNAEQSITSRTVCPSLANDQKMQNKDVVNAKPSMIRNTIVPCSEYAQEMRNVDVVNGEPSVVRRTISPSSSMVRRTQAVPCSARSSQDKQCQQSFVSRHTNTSEAQKLRSCECNIAVNTKPSVISNSAVRSPAFDQKMQNMDVVKGQTFMIQGSVTLNSANDQKMRNMDVVNGQPCVVRKTISPSSANEQNMRNIDAVNLQSTIVRRPVTPCLPNDKEMKNTDVVICSTQTERLLKSCECTNPVISPIRRIVAPCPEIDQEMRDVYIVNPPSCKERRSVCSSSTSTAGRTVSSSSISTAGRTVAPCLANNDVSNIQQSILRRFEGRSSIIEETISECDSRNHSIINEGQSSSEIRVLTTDVPCTRTQSLTSNKSLIAAASIHVADSSDASSQNRSYCYCVDDIRSIECAGSCTDSNVCDKTQVNKRFCPALENLCEEEENVVCTITEPDDDQQAIRTETLIQCDDPEKPIIYCRNWKCIDECYHTVQLPEHVPMYSMKIAIVQDFVTSKKYKRSFKMFDSLFNSYNASQTEPVGLWDSLKKIIKRKRKVCTGR